MHEQQEEEELELVLLPGLGWVRALRLPPDSVVLLPKP